MNNEPLEREPIDRMRARLEALLKANAAPRCGARSKRTGKPCQGAAMPNGRCKLRGGKSTGPRTQQAGKLETRALFAGSQGGTVAPAGGNTCAPRSLRLDLGRVLVNAQMSGFGDEAEILCRPEHYRLWRIPRSF